MLLGSEYSGDVDLGGLHAAVRSCVADMGTVGQFIPRKRFTEYR